MGGECYITSSCLWVPKYIMIQHLEERIYEICDFESRKKVGLISYWGYICNDSNIFVTLVHNRLTLRGRNISICKWINLYMLVLMHTHKVIVTIFLLSMQIKQAERFSYSFAFYIHSH